MNETTERDHTSTLALAMLGVLALMVGGLLLRATSPDVANTPQGTTLFRDTIYCVLPLGLLGILLLCGVYAVRHGGR